MILKPVIWLFCLLLPVLVFSQTAFLTGIVMDETGAPLEYANITIKESKQGTQTNAQGKFKLAVPAGQDFSILIKYIGFQEQVIPINKTSKPLIEIKIILVANTQNLSAVTISGKNSNTTASSSIMRLSPRISKEMPSVFNDFNKILATLPGVVSNNELTSTYFVRGGNYDENLVYVNGIEIYRPFLVSNAQQEGLSFVNPDLVQNIQFSSGAWQPLYGDKLSSVLSIEYKKPRKLAGSVTGGLMGGAFHLETISKNQRATYLLGVRYKNPQLVFNSLETNGNYQPNFLDAQAYITYNLSKKLLPGNAQPKTTLGVLASVARNQYEVVPSYRETSFGTTDRIVRLGIQFNGHERMEYETYQGGFNLSHFFNSQFFTEILGSALLTRERELRDVAATYSFYDAASESNQVKAKNDMVRNVETGTNFEHARNTLVANLFTLENRYTWQPDNRHTMQAGFKISRERIKDALKEYSLTDSADFITLNRQVASRLNLPSFRYQGFGQHTWQIDSLRTLTYGIRANYWTVNQELLISPRVQFRAILPHNPGWTFKMAAGYYYQPPFYRELRNAAGELNTNLKAQKSIHLVMGADYNFVKWSRPFKWTTQVYFKKLNNVVPYEVDNVRLRYFAQNNAKAYAAGLDLRINGEFIYGAESWFSLGIMTTKEDISGDSTIYDLKTFKKINKQPIGYIRRPTDQRVTFGFYFQDHIPNNPSLRLYLNGVVGTGLPFSPPGNESVRNQFNMPFYRRVDVGFSKLLTFRTSESDSGKSLESLWLSLEVLNLIAANNVVSYSYIKDIYNVTYAVPNYLSSRLVNLRFIARF